jgi:hypothetical protein
MEVIEVACVGAKPERGIAFEASAEFAGQLHPTGPRRLGRLGTGRRTGEDGEENQDRTEPQIVF